MEHAQSECRVRPGTNRNPLVRLTPGKSSDGIDHYELHSPGAGIRHIPQDVVEGRAGRNGKLRPYEDAIVAVMKVRLLMKAAGGKEFNGMDHLAASGRAVARIVGGAEGAGKGMQPE